MAITAGSCEFNRRELSARKLNKTCRLKLAERHLEHKRR